MATFRLDPDFKHRGFYSLGENEFELQVDGRHRLARTWTPLRVATCDEHLEDGLLEGDFPNLHPGMPIFSERAVAALLDLLEPNGELLPVLHEDGTRYLAFNVLTVLDVLDPARSDIDYYEGGVLDVEISGFRRLAFHQELLSAPIFKIPELAVSDVFVTDAFVRRVRKHRLRGFEFVPVESPPRRRRRLGGSSRSS